MKELNYPGRPDGLGNRIEEIIQLEALCSAEKLLVNYVWNNAVYDRSYDILCRASSVTIALQPKLHIDMLRISDFQFKPRQGDILASARRIEPLFDISFPSGANPVGVHIRGTDRIGQVHSHFMKDTREFNRYLSTTISLLNAAKPGHVFVCADNPAYRSAFVRHLDHSIMLVEPQCDPAVPQEYRDFFALALCTRIYMCSRFSSFSITASLVGNAPVVSYVEDLEIARRYQALFEYAPLGNEPELEIVRPQTKFAALLRRLVLRIRRKIFLRSSRS